MHQPINPYQSPSAPLPRSESVTRSRLLESRRVKAMKAPRWLTDGVGLMSGGAVGIIVILLLIAIPYSVSAVLEYRLERMHYLLVYLPGLLFGPLSTVCLGGIMVAFEQRPFQAKTAIDAMRAHLVPLAVLGALTSIVFLTASLMLGFVAYSFWGSELTGLDTLQPLKGVALLVLAVAAFVAFIFYLAAAWFSPALVAIGNVRPGRAMGRSIRACMTNFLPFLLLIIVSVVIFFAVMLLIGVIAGITVVLVNVTRSSMSTDFAPEIWEGFGVVSGHVITGILFIWVAATQYCSFVDVFAEDA